MFTAPAALLLLAALQAPPGFRLPDTVRPISYQVHLTLDPAVPEISGAVEIHVRLTEASSRVWLNAKGLQIEKAMIRAGAWTLPAQATLVEDEFVALETSAPVAAGPAVLMLEFRGRIDDRLLVGPYRRRVGPDWYLFTTFTPIEARRAFPCFDEPRYKSTWQFHLSVPAALQAFTNAPATSATAREGGWKTVHFEQTHLLPAEVTAFAVGPFDATAEARAGRKRVPVRTITPRGQAASGLYAAQATDAVLRRLEKYTGIAYPWRKLDHIALPEGAFGAVENPGLITYLSSSLLLTPERDVEDRRRALRGLMTHELSHQWFGNLVTQSTWKDVWMSEGFATWLTARMMDQERPATLQNLNAIEARERIMLTDAGARTRAVRVEMPDRTALRGAYSPFVYQKAGAVLLMLEQWLGAGRFQSGLRAYLKRHAKANAGLSDFEAVLPPAAAPVLESFLNRTGIPEVSAEARCGPGAGPALVLSQAGGQEPWTIPVCWRTDQASGCTVVDKARKEVPLRACPAWILPNARGAGYYRSKWPSGRMPPAAALTPAERLTLVYDLKSGGSLDLLKPFVEDADAQVARAARRALNLPQQ
ncbi:MAG: hypothetical protein HY821_17775 [Acidobacteria bacterium]|nr:hypothetical protein [Acidobacteriota bacterium]